MSEWQADKRVEVKTEVDQVESMKSNGQYIYVSVLDGDGDSEPVDPLVKFNNGHEGGSSSALFNDTYQQDPEGLFHALYKDKIDPELRKRLGPPPTEAAAK
eukprot:TRINITY_DN34631_c0_g1_i1.p1 TRINITY_DN34631_c0_g1~~TRINITY_DN34631_c0_g1_i1.p1  ORF type:complete len:101 (+),score=21.45 TRINITY_DN34631_c0_g1_i1:151-453(+)